MTTIPMPASQSRAPHSDDHRQDHCAPTCKVNFCQDGEDPTPLIIRNGSAQEAIHDVRSMALTQITREDREAADLLVKVSQFAHEHGFQLEQPDVKDDDTQIDETDVMYILRSMPKSSKQPFLNARKRKDDSQIEPNSTSTSGSAKKPKLILKVTPPRTPTISPSKTPRTPDSPEKKKKKAVLRLHGPSPPGGQKQEQLNKMPLSPPSTEPSTSPVNHKGGNLAFGKNTRGRKKASFTGEELKIDMVDQPNKMGVQGCKYQREESPCQAVVDRKTTRAGRATKKPKKFGEEQ
ncbi:hypothetical protein MMC09_003152 [Bachmanniomyces sp. S44760]|nr:hypothetical protein [Bachmanniomyces sp. S44760]